jgi:hypothetical protein
MNWIDVNERLPEIGQECLVAGCGLRLSATYDRAGWFKETTDKKSGHWGDCGCKCETANNGYCAARAGWISHWMPMPDHPEMEPSTI